MKDKNQWQRFLALPSYLLSGILVIVYLLKKEVISLNMALGLMLVVIIHAFWSTFKNSL